MRHNSHLYIWAEWDTIKFFFLKLQRKSPFFCNLPLKTTKFCWIDCKFVTVPERLCSVAMRWVVIILPKWSVIFPFCRMENNRGMGDPHGSPKVGVVLYAKATMFFDIQYIVHLDMIPCVWLNQQQIFIYKNFNWECSLCIVSLCAKCLFSSAEDSFQP